MERLIGYLEGREGGAGADSALVRLSAPVCCLRVNPEGPYPEDTPESLQPVTSELVANEAA